MQKGYWLEKNDINYKYSYLSKDICCDVTIIGGGISGAITAYILAKEGLRVTVIEKNIIGYKNSGVSSGCITDFIDEMYIKYENRVDKNIINKYSQLKQRARKIFNLMIKELETSYQVANYMFIDTRMFQKRTLRNEMNLRNELEEETSFLERDENINSNNILQIKRGAYLINPYKLAQEIFRYLSTFDNVNIYENTFMKKIDSIMNKMEVTTQNDFKIISNSAIITTPTECIDFVNGNKNIQIDKRFSLVADSISNKNLCGKIFNDIPLYFRNTKENIIISGIDTKYISKMENYKYLESLKEENKRKLETVLEKLFPNLKIQNSNIYCANILKTSDLLPIISEIEEIPNLYLNVGSGCSSIMQTIIGAEFLKDAVRGYYPKEMNFFKLKRN